MHDVYTQTLGSAVATSGTFTVSYATGVTRGAYIGGWAHRISALGAVYYSPTDFTVSFGTSTATITWLKATTLAAGTRVSVQLDRPGGAYYPGKLQRQNVTDIYDAQTVQSVQDCPTVMLNLGSPIATTAVSLRAAAALATTGSFTLLTAGMSFDVPRNVIFTSSGNDTGVVFTITGTDFFGQSMSEAVTGANAGVAAGVKAFYKILTISNSAAAAGTVSIGVGNVLGLPRWVPSSGHIVKELMNWASATAGTFVAGLSSLTTSTTTTADVRGTYVPNSAPDGSKAYVLIVALPDPQFIGVPQV